MKKLIFIILMCGVIVFGITGCGKSNLNDTKNDLEESQNKYGFVQEETVDVLVAKFNTEVLNNTSLNKASLDYLTVSNNQYWYGLYEGVSLVVVPKKFTGNKETEIVDYMLIFVQKNSEYEKNVIDYTKYLIKSNNSSITDEEIDELIKDAKEKSTSGKTSNNGKGISVGYLDNNDTYQYQVLRFYK